jgi:cytoskeletal protein CcmA (bactofilin family)
VKRKIIKVVLTSIVLLILLTPKVCAKERVKRTSRVVTVPSTETITQDFYVKSGEVVEVSGTVNGDVIIVGGQITIDGTVNGDLLAAGGTVNVSGEITQDARIAGGQLTITGDIGRNLTVAGGNIEILESAKLGGGVITVGGSVLLGAPVTGDVKVAAGDLIVASDITGDIEATVGTLHLTSRAAIAGNFTYTSEQDPLIDEGATISGQILRKTLPTVSYNFSSIKNFDKQVQRGGIYLKFASFLSALVMGFLMLRFFPSCSKNTSEKIGEEPWKSLGLGFLTLILAPFAFLLVLITIVGIPIAVVAIFAYFMFIYLSKIIFSYWIGLKLNEMFKTSFRQYFIYTFGLAIYYLLRLIPIVGGVTALVVPLFGVGAIVLGCADFYRKLVKAKAI